MLKQHLQFKLSQKLSPQQIQLMKLIQLPTQAFEQRLKQKPHSSKSYTYARLKGRSRLSRKENQQIEKKRYKSYSC